MSKFAKVLSAFVIAATTMGAYSVSAGATTLAGADNGRRAVHRSTMRHHHMMMKRQMMRSHRMQMDHGSRM